MGHTSQLQKGAEINIKSAKEIAQLSKTTSDAFLTKLFGEYEFNRYGIISMLILAVVCLGGLAVAFGSLTSPVQIAFLIVPTMATLTFILAVAPMRLILYTALTSMTISTILIIYHILV